MNVIAINGSPKANGNTAAILKIMCAELEGQGIGTQILHVGDKVIRGCTDCGYCFDPSHDGCVFRDDPVNDIARRMRQADGILLGAPTYYAGIPGPMKAFLDRVFFSNPDSFRYKVGTAITTVRRAGGSDVVRALRNYFDLAEILTPPAQYWLAAFGGSPGEVLKDPEGIQSVQKNARAMAWLMRTVAAGKETIPQEEPHIFTNFIR